MSGNKANKTKGKPGSGGARAGAGKPATIEGGRVKIIASVLPDTREALRILGAKTNKGRAATVAGFGALILDGWQEKGGYILGEKKYAPELPAAYAIRRVQVTCWVSKETKKLISNMAIDSDKTPASVSGTVLDLWATRQAAIGAVATVPAPQ